MPTLASRLSQAMAKSGVDQTDLAARVGASQSAISKIARGKTVNSRYLASIAVELGVTTAWLLGREEGPREARPTSRQEREWLELLRRLSPRYRAAVIQLSRTIADGESS